MNDKKYEYHAKLANGEIISFDYETYMKIDRFLCFPKEELTITAQVKIKPSMIKYMFKE